MSIARILTFSFASFSESPPHSSFGQVRWSATAMLSFAAPPSDAAKIASACGRVIRAAAGVKTWRSH